MHRRQFLQGLGAALAAVLTRGKGKAAEVEVDQPTPVGRKSMRVLDGFGLAFISDELLQDAGTGLEQWVKNNTPLTWDWSGPVVYDTQSLTTRTAYQVSAHASFMRDEGRVIARYDVAGTDRVLIVMSWISHEIEEDEAAVGFILGMMDDEAEYIAAHPDEAPSSHWEWA